MIEWLDDFGVRAVIAGLIMVAIAAPMGCLMVWQRLAFLSDTLGHAAVMGVGLGLLLQVQPIFGVLAVALLIVFSLSRVTGSTPRFPKPRSRLFPTPGLRVALSWWACCPRIRLTSKQFYLAIYSPPPPATY